VIKAHGALSIVDTITGLGVHELRFDEWNIDVAVAGSQKGLMLPPGLAFAAVSDEAWAAAEQSDLPNYYLSFLRHRKSWGQQTTPWTPAISLFMGLAGSLDMLLKDGLEALWSRHERMADAMRAAVRALGLPLFPRVPGNIQTVIKLPPELEYKKISSVLYKKYGMKIAGGQDHLTGKILRIAHFGYVDDGDVLAAVGFLERALLEQNWNVTPGEAVAAAQKVLVTK
jgi:serine---pyruvate transaminase